MASGSARSAASALDFTDEDHRLLRAFLDVVEESRPELDAAVEDAARRLPIFAEALARMDPETRAQQAHRSAELQRDALANGRWDGYLEHLRHQGRTYAEIGVAFAQWYSLLGAYRGVIADRVLPRGTDTARDVLAGMGKFLDLAMSTIADAYIARKQELVRDAEARLDLYIKMFSHASVAMLIYEWESPPDRSSFRLVDANGSSEATAAIGHTVAESAPPLGDRLTGGLASAIEDREASSWSHRHAAGEVRYYDVHCFPLGERFVGIIYDDVSKSRRLESELARHVRDLERSNRELDEFAYVASHDLKSPLRDIDTLSGWVTEDAEDALSESSRRHLYLVRDRIGRMERLLDDLLEYSRAGRLFSAPEEIALREQAEQVAELLTPPAGFEITVRGDDPQALSPKPPFQQVVRNLVANALRHHDKDAGHVAIELRDGEHEATVSRPRVPHVSQPEAARRGGGQRDGAVDREEDRRISRRHRRIRAR